MKNKIIGGVIGLIILSLIGYKYYQVNYAKETLVENNISTVNEPRRSGSNTDNVSVENNTSINVEVETPVNGTYKGVVEVGASGFNCFVVNIDKDKNWELVYKEFGKSLAYEGFLTTDDVKSTLKNYISTISEKGVAGRNTHFVVSSGALKNPKTTIIMDAISKMGYVVNKVDASREGQLALKALLPKSYKQSGFVVDIGSGNTKISWYDSNGNLKSLEGSGAKYYQDNKQDGDVYNEIKSLLSQVPTNLKQNCFIIGGIPFKLAEESRNGQERFTQLRNPDDYSAGDDIKKKSGLNIYRSIYENASQTVIFDWDANFTIGFLLNLN